MKIKTLSSIALLTTVGIVAVSSNVVSAAVISKQDSTGKLTVEQGSLDPGAGVVDPENPEKDPLPTDPDNGPIYPNPTDPGSKGIMGVSNLDFGKVSVGTKEAYASHIEVDGKVRGNLVAFGDVTGKYSGYTIKGALTSQFTNGTTTLNGASISFTNPLLKSSGEGVISGETATQTLSESAGAVTFVTAAKTEGSGKWSLEFGQSEEYNKANSVGDGSSTADKSVKLDIPASVANAMTTGAYTAVVTWSMDAEPSN